MDGNDDDYEVEKLVGMIGEKRKYLAKLTNFQKSRRFCLKTGVPILGKPRCLFDITNYGVRRMPLRMQPYPFGDHRSVRGDKPENKELGKQTLTQWIVWAEGREIEVIKTWRCMEKGI